MARFHVVISPTVTASKNTKELIDKISPHLPPGTKVIGGLLNYRQQVWKLNWHWEKLIDTIDRCLAIPTLQSKYKDNLSAIRVVLAKNAPPVRGFTKPENQTAAMNTPSDPSNERIVRHRWRAVFQSKRDFKSVMHHAKLSNLDAKLAHAIKVSKEPIRPPGQSHHGFGYALDLSGKNAEISKCCLSLGASLVYDEDGHVHAEFKDFKILDKPNPKLTTPAYYNVHHTFYSSEHLKN